MCIGNSIPNQNMGGKIKWVTTVKGQSRQMSILVIVHLKIKWVITNVVQNNFS